MEAILTIFPPLPLRNHLTCRGRGAVESTIEHDGDNAPPLLSSDLYKRILPSYWRIDRARIRYPLKTDIRP